MQEFDSRINRLGTDPITLASVGTVLTSIVASLVAFIVLTDTIRIRWYVGEYEHWGPKYIAAEPLLLLFPTAVGFGYLVTRVFRHQLQDKKVTQAYDLAVLFGLVGLLSIQLLVIILNVVIP